MNFNPFTLYKVVEIGNGIAVINATMKSEAADAVELIVADLGTCLTYLERYVIERMNRKTMGQAHANAMFGLTAVRSWSPSYER